MGKDYYKILGVNKNASQDEIKRAFRKLAHQYHPDKTGGDEAKFKEANEAYQVLGDPKRRSQYDQFGSAFEQAQSGGGFHGFDGFRDFSNYANGFNINVDDLGDIFGGFSDIFGFGGGSRNSTQSSRRGRDLHISLTLNFQESIFGVEREIRLNKQVVCKHCGGSGAASGSAVATCRTCGGTGRVMNVQRTILGQMQVQSACPECRGEGRIIKEKCPECRGEGRVHEPVTLNIKIPSGIQDGQTIRLSGHGEAGDRGAQAGDLFIEIKVAPDKRFHRQADNILSQIEISFKQAALGDKIDVETVDGTVVLKIPEGTQSGAVLKLKNKGVPHRAGHGRGDHLAEVIVKTPTKLNRRQKQLLNDLDI